MNVMGLDVGTTGCKATVLNEEGKVVASAYREYALVSPRPGWHELNSAYVLKCAKQTIGECTQRSKGDRIVALSVSSLGEAVTPIDAKGEALGNSIIYIDPRGADEAKHLEEKLGSDRILEITGVAAHPMYSLPKIMWLKRHMPELYKSAWKFLLYADFILFKLGARAHTDYSLAARTMGFDVVGKKWSEEVLGCAGMDLDKFGEPVQAGTVVGEIAKPLADELGLPRGVLLVAGGHDQPCAALGSGAIWKNVAADGMGTTECITPAFDRPVISRAMAACGFACVPHVIRDMYVTYAFSFTSGSMLKWFRDAFACEEKLESAKTGKDAYEILIEKASRVNTNVFILPHFAGAATPYMDPDAKGVALGLGIDTTREEIFKAILEGITFEAMVNLECLEKAGIAVNELRVSGGLAKSDYMLQLKADMMGRKIVSLNASEAGTVGVAILAAAAGGIFKSIDEAVSRLVTVKKEYRPDDKRTLAYAEKFQTYKKIYPAFKSIAASRGA